MKLSPNKSLKGVRIRSLDSLNRRMLRILRAACVCPLALRYKSLGELFLLETKIIWNYDAKIA
jgi:hypothetical protein